ncbi:MAG: ATP-binding cassette domain-containing protein, partial [Achromobacter pestifer]
IELSGGEQQRLAIARAIVNRPAILIADEPTANLDHDNAQRIMNVFRDFNRVGVTTLIASHDQDLMARYATRTLRIDPGKFADSNGTQTPPDAGQPQGAPARTGSGRAEPGLGHPGESA